ncbi:MAG: hydantoinase/oxoprolinase family protein [Alphaproteobacteria bacterium]|nr:hydantoinase/oxoprolinase family protein [Alphaproteobacteria bacterium]
MKCDEAVTKAAKGKANFSVGLDIGGTFTDIVFYDQVSGRHLNRKVLTTHEDPSLGVIEGVRQVIDSEGVDPASVDRVIHATTLFTNALIERKGAETGLVTTEGFRDLLEIARERKYEIYDVFIEMPSPIVPRNLVAEVPGRIGPRGEEERPLDLPALVAGTEQLVKQGVTSVAVVFLHSYVNPSHERAAVAEIQRRFPSLSISASCEVAPEIREYERASTTVINAYVKPLAQNYLDRLAAQLAATKILAPLFMMLSNGGLTHVAEAKRVPVQLLESGPAAGALAGAFFGRGSKVDHVLAFDMGGTTAKLSVVDDGEPVVAYRFEAAREKRFAEGSGLPVIISVIELIEIGAGGGSIASVDELGLLKVGPRSAGSQPGPAAYGRGGQLPTVTDADFILGYLDPGFFAGGTMKIDLDAAKKAFEPICKATGMSLPEAAWGVHDVVNENMASAARVHVAERGKDPRDYALLPTGGAGPVHAYSVAAKLGLKRVICPPAAGVASSLGLLMAPARVDRAATFLTLLDETDWPALEGVFRKIEADARDVIAGTGLDPKGARIDRLADMRYAGQGFELVVFLPEGPYSAKSRDGIAAAFEAAYRATFGRTPRSGSIEIVNIRACVRVAASAKNVVLKGFGSGDGGLKGRRPVWFPETKGYTETAVYDRYRLPSGVEHDGPAVIEERESTLVIGPGATFRVEATGNLAIDVFQA